MQLLQALVYIASWVFVPVTEAYTPAPTIQTDLLAAAARVTQDVYHANSIGKKCSPLNAAVRKEWGSLSKSDRKAYTNAVLCLMSLPPKSDPAVVPGARSRFDDFGGVHIQQTPTIHNTANFLSWHRYYTWAYEQALRNECGYTGYQPYWNWGKSAFDQLGSPYFDGSDSSMSGNGDFEAHPGTQAVPPFPSIPPGQGGGCVRNGPFKNITVDLGPVFVLLNVSEVHPTATGLSYNPRCLRRDITTFLSSTNLRDSDSFDLIANYKTIGPFQERMQGNFVTGFTGVHTAGHLTFLGDPGGDLFSAPGDPMFFLHHGQIDRTWWIWQNQDPRGRYPQIADTITGGNNPPSRNGTLDDVISLGAAGVPDVKIRDVVDTMAGPLCYRYE